MRRREKGMIHSEKEALILSKAVAGFRLGIHLTKRR
jgi:hypothetical protein